MASVWNSLTAWGLGGLVCAAIAAAQETATRPASPDTERLAGLIALVEGPNAPDIRRTGARELLLLGWPDTAQRLCAILTGANAAAKVAVATVLAELPAQLEPAYIEPLMAMLADSDAGVREAGGAALAAYPDNGVTTRLRELALDPDRTQALRLAAIGALGLMTERTAVEALAAALEEPDAAVSQAALVAMGRATAIDFNEVAAAQVWWQETSNLTLEQWQQRQIERLVRKDRESHRRVEALEARLAKVLEAGFQRAPDAERIALLGGYLADPSATIRLLGLKLVQLHVAGGKTLPSEMQERIRELLTSVDPRELAAAVRTVASLRDARDAERFTEMLPRARHHDVRLALLNGLGHAGTSAVVGVLLETLAAADEASATEAVTALGRLAERNVLAAEQRDDVVAALLEEWESSEPTRAALRERILWALGSLGDLRAGPTFAAAVDRAEAAVVRQAAVKGIAALKNPQLADALTGAINDPDAGVRKAAVEALAQLGSSTAERHVQVLWDRAVSNLETDETIRQAAWRGVLEILARGSPTSAERWVARLTGSGPQDVQRATELLERLARMIQDSEPVERARLGGVRARLAAQYVVLDRPAEAIAMYADALADLHAVKAESAGRVALELLRFSLMSGRYDEFVARALANAESSVSATAYFEMIEAVIEARLNTDGPARALAMLKAVSDNPPGAWPPGAAEKLQTLRERAAQPAPAPESGPATRSDALRG
jgi:HEAT repeat protein